MKTITAAVLGLVGLSLGGCAPAQISEACAVAGAGAAIVQADGAILKSPHIANNAGTAGQLVATDCAAVQADR